MLHPCWGLEPCQTKNQMCTKTYACHIFCQSVVPVRHWWQQEPIYSKFLYKKKQHIYWGYFLLIKSYKRRAIDTVWQVPLKINGSYHILLQCFPVLRYLSFITLVLWISIARCTIKQIKMIYLATNTFIKILWIHIYSFFYLILTVLILIILNCCFYFILLWSCKH